MPEQSADQLCILQTNSPLVWRSHGSIDQRPGADNIIVAKYIPILAMPPSVALSRRTIQQLRMPDICVLADGASRTNNLRSAHAGAILKGMCSRFRCATPAAPRRLL
jgi:hypothetical protein